VRLTRLRTVARSKTLCKKWQDGSMEFATLYRTISSYGAFVCTLQLHLRNGKMVWWSSQHCIIVSYLYYWFAVGEATFSTSFDCPKYPSHIHIAYPSHHVNHINRVNPRQANMAIAIMAIAITLIAIVNHAQYTAKPNMAIAIMELQ
jgi:hypothetical protein